MALAALALATLIGVSLGLLGGGGSILTVPIFVYVLGFAAKPAIAMTLPVVGTASFVGALSHWRAGNVDLRQAAVFGLVTMAGAFTGAKLAPLLSGAVQLTILAVVMLAAAVAMLRPVVGADTAPRRGGTRHHVILGLVGIAVGVLTGLVGVGGGFLIVPALALLARIPMKQAVGTSLVVIAMNSAAGFAGHAGEVDIPWDFLTGFTAAAVVGILVGTYATRYVAAAALRRGFAVFLLVIGAAILYANRDVFTATRDVPSASRATTTSRSLNDAAAGPRATRGDRPQPSRNEETVPC